MPDTASRRRNSPPKPIRSCTGRSRPHELTFWPSSVISRTPSRASASTSDARVSSDRDCSRPRTDGTMQYEQVELQPIEICTPRLVCAVAMRGQVARELVERQECLGELAACPDEVAEPRDVARPEGQVDERIALEQLVLHRLRPAAADDDRALGMPLLGRSACIRSVTKRSSAFSRIVQVLKTTTSASSWLGASPSPSDSSRPLIRSESCTFIWQPNVVTW